MGTSYYCSGVDKAAVVCQLHAIIDHYLLGEGSWPVPTEALPSLYKTFRELGLNEDCLVALIYSYAAALTWYFGPTWQAQIQLSAWWPVATAATLGFTLAFGLLVSRLFTEPLNRIIRDVYAREPEKVALHSPTVYASYLQPNLAPVMARSPNRPRGPR
jgi:hypothetical protein